ncbi:hypothetical protein Hamer_G011917 [Homarus americanus]|uniref:Uncharacterized protein n=1 Tax=Homarus americanus TaxID=6706 RepID=A0A8J5JYK9_HOMAM|nr:hypothetical protein Hamer_G011917 [Homarus americanus]
MILMMLRSESVDVTDPDDKDRDNPDSIAKCITPPPTKSTRMRLYKSQCVPDYTSNMHRVDKYDSMISSTVYSRLLSNHYIWF